MELKGGAANEPNVDGATMSVVMDVHPRQATTSTPLQPSPAADLLLAFVNTRPVQSWPERYSDGRAMGDWLVECGLLEPDALVTDADAATARELRTALVAVLLAHAGADPDPDADAILERIGQQHPLRAQLDAVGARLHPISAGVSGLYARLLAAATELALTNTWTRLKACRNPVCHYAFYDRSRNTSATYCTSTCAGQVAMRTHRARVRGAD